MKYNPNYDINYIVKGLAVVGAVVALMRATGGSGFVIAVPLALAALLRNKPDKMMFWLMFAVCAVAFNAKLMPKNIVFALSQRGLMVMLGFLVASKVFGGIKSRILKPFVFMFLYVLCLAASSATGWSPLISYLKLFLFSIVYFAYLGVAKQVSSSSIDNVRKIRSNMLIFAIVFLFGSVVLIPFPAISQLSWELAQLSPTTTSLFTGMTTHSQALGPLVAMFNVILLSDMLFSLRKFDKLYCVLLACCPILIYKTSSRTGMGTYLLSTMFLIYIFMKARGIGNNWRSKAFSSLMTIISLFLAILLFVPGTMEKARKFVLKWDGAGDMEMTYANVVSTRQGLVDVSIANFKEKPLLGNGFQVSRAMLDLPEDRRSILSAPVEKGVWYAAVLEEGGVCGFIVFVTFLVLCLGSAVKNRGYATAATLIAFTLTNFGEFTFFSMSYTGGICWMMVFVAAIFDTMRERERRSSPGPYVFSWGFR